MRVCIVGCGNIAQVHWPIILKQADCQIAAVCDGDVAKAKSLADQLKLQKIYQHAANMVEKEQPEILHILTPPQYHSELAVMAMNRGCHVFVEKPMSFSLDEAESMITAAKKNNVFLCVDHNFVFDNTIQRVKNAAFEGQIGAIVTVEVHFTYDIRRNIEIYEEGAEYSHWSYRMNGGPLEDLMPHPASLIMEFLPDVRDVLSTGHNRGRLPKGWQDEIRVLIKSSTGVLGYIGISISEKPDTVSLTIKGTKGKLHADLFKGAMIYERSLNIPRAITRGISGFDLSKQYFTEGLKNIWKFARGTLDKTSGMEALVAEFYNAIRSGSSPPISLEKSLAVMDIINRIWPEPTPALEPKKSTSKRQEMLKNGPVALVTGGSGFIGSHLVKKLHDLNFRVRVLVRPSSPNIGRLKKYDIEIIEGDLGDIDALMTASKGVDLLYHLGFPIGGSWDLCKRVGIGGTKSLIEIAIRNEVDRFVYLSTLNVYDILEADGQVINEDATIQNDCISVEPYTWAKIECEKLLFNAQSMHGLQMTILRPGIVVGPLGRPFFPHLGFRYQNSFFIIIGKGDNILPLTYVENTVDAIYKASIDPKAVGEIFNIVDNGEVTPNLYLDRFAEVSNNEAKIFRVPYLLPYIAAAAYELLAELCIMKKGVTSRRQLKWKQVRVKFDSSKADRVLNWQPAISMDDGLSKTFKWYVKKYVD